MALSINRLDHLVLTVLDVERTCSFYSDLLGMEVIHFGAGRRALRFGAQKINLHEAGNELEPRAHRATPGSGDLCFVTDSPLEVLLRDLQAAGVEVLDGPVPRTGALGPIDSVYFRDPDLNLIEVSRYQVP
jgi:catechol 2,3-dioxygenase-like lactoylglutathione lyase family enzyme